jgi:hypothetical protein
MMLREHNSEIEVLLKLKRLERLEGLYSSACP